MKDKIKELTSQDLITIELRNTLAKTLPKETVDKLNDEQIEKITKEIIETDQEAKATDRIGEKLKEITEPITKGGIIDGLKHLNDGYKTGYKVLDKDGKDYEDNDKEIILSGGAITIISAPTKHGKTTAMLNLLLATAQAYKNKTHYFISYEENKTALVVKMLSSYLGFKVSKGNYQSLRKYLKGGEDKSVFDKDFRAILEKSPNKLEDKITDFFNAIQNIRIVYGAENIIDLLHLIGNKQDTGAVFIDYMQMIPSEETVQGYEKIKTVCNSLKSVAVDKDLSLVIASQFGRGVTNPDGLIAQRLAEGSDIEKVANRVYGLWHFGKQATYDNGKDNRYKKYAQNENRNKNQLLISLMISRDGDTWDGLFNADYNIKKIGLDGKDTSEIMNGGGIVEDKPPSASEELLGEFLGKARI